MLTIYKIHFRDTVFDTKHDISFKHDTVVKERISYTISETFFVIETGKQKLFVSSELQY